MFVHTFYLFMDVVTRPMEEYTSALGLNLIQGTNRHNSREESASNQRYAFCLERISQISHSIRLTP